MANVSVTPGVWARPRLRDAYARARQAQHPLVLGPNLFRDVLERERWRAHRFNECFTLIVVSRQESASDDLAWRLPVQVLCGIKRDTDILGWLDSGKALGLIVPEMASSERGHLSSITSRLREDLTMQLGASGASYSVTEHRHELSNPSSAIAAPLQTPGAATFGSRVSASIRDALKRALDVVGSAALLALLSPVFAVIALLIKAKSPGPVFFRQERVGQSGKPFMMLKFRTMHVDNDPSIHRQFVSEFIKAGAPANGDANGDAPFKIVGDPRVTSIGLFLRRSSLDELPQFLNVLLGDMSLVGPRPPLRYEVEQYQPWHYRRVLDAKPGITGLWQVSGRSRTTFDEMVRLDLRYAKRSSPWTDIKILLATPRAVISGKGAR
jgi:lipopolysaccharide/colanic/teichoic acid biosynthesis glycosyltransferase